MNRQEIAAILASAGLRPRHAFGQNFMVDQHVLAEIVAAGNIHEHDVILEIGPGVGNLTRLLAQAAPHGAVLAVDIDRKLLPAAQRHHAANPAMRNVTWLLSDALAGKHAIEPQVLTALADLHAAHPQGHLKLVSNLPYNAASPLIAELLVEMWKSSHETPASTPHFIIHNSSFIIPFSRLAFTVQWEVAQRMAAQPDTRDYGPLGILIQSLATVEILRKIPPGAFWPPPKVHSALVVVTPLPKRMAALADAPGLQAFLAGVFSHRRQTLANALKHHLAGNWTSALKQVLAEAGFDLTRRPENFPVEALLKLRSLASHFAAHAIEPPHRNSLDVNTRDDFAEDSR
jgi:16S rRNA (adenine1518-N6/adenine1519-N6)-dimethyltransferase